MTRQLNIAVPWTRPNARLLADMLSVWPADTVVTHVIGIGGRNGTGQSYLTLESDSFLKTCGLNLRKVASRDEAQNLMERVCGEEKTGLPLCPEGLGD